MTYVEWESEFKKCINRLPQKEKDEILGYYREIYADKREAGLSDEEIIENFDEPMLEAAKILMEHNIEGKGTQETESENPPAAESTTAAPTKPKFPVPRFPRKITIASVVGWFFLLVLFVIPLVAVIFSAFAAVVAVAASGFAIAIGGVVLTVASPFAFLLGYTGLGVLATLGTALAMVGIGIVLFEAFYIIAKYFASACFKLSKYFFIKRRLNKNDETV